MARLVFSILGGLGAQIDSETVELGTRKQRAVLAQLILAAGAPVSVDRLIDDIWGERAPDRAGVSVQAYISGLRKALEPDRRPRSPATVLVTAGAGYALRTDDDQVDARHLLARITTAHDRHRCGDPAAAAALLQTALADYRPLLPEFEGLAFRDDAAAHLERTVAEAQEFSYEVRLELGEHRALVPELEQAVRRSPLDEGLWVLLAIARYRLGRQSDALAAIAEARRTLADEVGVDPGPRLRALESDILDHAPSLDPSGSTVTVGSSAAQPESPSSPRPPATLVGRTDELAVLHRAVLGSLSGPGGVVVVDGEPGAGKSALLDEATRRAASAADLTVLWGRCAEDMAAPSMWPWVQVLGGVLPTIDDTGRSRMLDTELGRMVTQGATVIPPPREMPDAAARFRLYDQAADLLDRVAETRLLVIVLDDLQWADGASLELLAHMAARRTPGVAFFASLRATPLRPAVTDVLDALARLPEHRRLSIGALSSEDVTELLRREIHEQPAPDLVETIHRRTGGNAFFVRELARILADHGSIDGHAVTDGVRGVVAGRIRPLPPRTIELLEVAAVIGSRVDIALLADAASQSVSEVLESLDPAFTAAVVDIDPADPFTITFDHDLVRESIVDRIPRTRACHIHLAVADRLDPDSSTGAAARLAGHLWAAGPLADRSRTARALLTAGRIALRTYGFDTADRQLADAATLARSAGDPHLELEVIRTRLTAEVARNGYFAADRELLDRARELGEATRDAALLAHLDYARFAAHAQLADMRVSHRYADDLYRRAQDSDDAVVVHLGMQAAGIDSFDRGRIGEAARILQTYAPLTPVDGLQSDQLLIAQGFRGLAATMHLGVHAGRRLFEQIDRGPEEPMAYVGAAVFAATAAALAGDVDWARESAERLMGVSEHLPLEYLRQGGERIYWWARALDDATEDALAHLTRLQSVAPRQRTGLGLWLALHAEALIVADRLDGVPALLEQAQSVAEQTGQRYPDPHRLLVCAEFQHAAGHPATAVVDTLREAGRIAMAQESTTLVTRIDDFAADHGYSRSH
ncbi:BTAD domain-containing putative transcriptional regulator [Gordonia sp. CPCC 206044]|uniref:BTAD domain-containing putative transcriptional regulator n=1 Tax=Gordonia sp. CPCC 206044 TaxID=3140793 RepID=UPI003AF36138